MKQHPRCELSIQSSSGAARGRLGVEPPLFSNFSARQTSQKVVVFEEEKDCHNYDESAPAFCAQALIVFATSALAFWWAKCLTADTQSDQILDCYRQRCAERNSRAPFQGITASFWSLPGEDAACVIRRRKVHE